MTHLTMALDAPPEVYLHIMTWLSPRDGVHLAMSCRRLYQLLPELYLNDFRHNDSWALGWACATGNLNTLHQAISFVGADVDIISRYFTRDHASPRTTRSLWVLAHTTPLVVAVRAGQAHVVSHLLTDPSLAQQPDKLPVLSRHHRGLWYPVHYAMELPPSRPQIEILRLLFSAGAGVDQIPVAHVTKTLGLYDAAPIQQALTYGPGPRPESSGHSFFTLDDIAQARRLVLIQFLAQNGASMSTPDVFGRPPLIRIMYELLEWEPRFPWSGAAVTTSDKELQASKIRKNAWDMITTLLSAAGGDWRLVHDRRPYWNQTPLHMVCSMDSSRLPIVLYDNEWSNHRSHPRDTRSFAFRLAELLLHHGADLGAVDIEGRTPLHAECFKDNPELERLDMLTQHASIDTINATDHDGRTPLHLVCRFAMGIHEYDAVKLLVARGAEVGKEDAAGHTAQHYAKEKGNKEVGQFLMMD